MVASLLCISGCIALLGVAAASAVEFEPAAGHTSTVYFTDTGTIVSFDWDSNGQLFYLKGDEHEPGFYKVENGSPERIVSFANAGTSVAVVGDYIFLNGKEKNEEAIYRYESATGACGEVHYPEITRFYAGVNSLLTFSGAKLSFMLLDDDGYFVRTPWQTLADFHGQSGPLAVDRSGSLYLAVEGSGIIYRWDAATVSAGMATPDSFSFANSNHSISLASLSQDVEQINSIAVNENGDIYLALNYNSNAGYVLKVTLDGEEEVILFSDERLSDLRLHGGSLFVASGGTIFEVSIPEPSAFVIVVLGLGVAAATRRSWRRG